MGFFISFVYLAMVALSVVLSVYLFVSLKKDIHGSEARRQNEEAQLTREVEELKKRTQELEELSDAAVPGMTVSKRSHAVRRMQRGEGPEQIASALGLPLTEVELLIKVEERLSRLTS